MKYGIVSDFHIDTWKPSQVKDLFRNINDSEADVIIYAGDFYDGAAYTPGTLTSSITKNLIYVHGNHDFYHNEIYSHQYDCNGWFVATLWTDFWKNPLAEFDASRNIADFKKITRDGRKLLPADLIELNHLHVDAIRKTEKKLILTHFPPTVNSISAKYRLDPLNPYFVNNRSDLLEGKSLWVHGHVHNSFDYIHESGCRVVCNPLGYRGENFFNINDYRVKIVEI